MAFPSTSVLDDFNRANALLTASGNWGAMGGVTSLSVISNQCGSGSGDRASYWSASSFGGRNEVYATCGVVQTGMWLYCKVTSPTAAAFGFATAYALSYDGGSSWRLWKWSGGTQTQLGASITTSFTAGDVVGIDYDDVNTLTFYKNGVAVTTRTDTTGAGVTGYIGLECENTTGRWEDFGGGAVSSGTTFNDSGSGTLALSGSSSESITYDDASSGQLTLSGSGAESIVYNDAATGTLALSGSGLEDYQPPVVYNDAATGMLVLTGSGVEDFQGPPAPPAPPAQRSTTYTFRHGRGFRRGR